jgi:hypothetical protein
MTEPTAKPLADLTDDEIRTQIEDQLKQDRERVEQGLILEDEWIGAELTPEYLAYLERRATISRQMLAERGIRLPERMEPPTHAVG